MPKPKTRDAHTISSPQRIGLRAAALAVVALLAVATAAVAHPSRLARGGGVAHAAVVGGQTAIPPSWPWLAFIADTLNDTACSGTVISPMVVLTAGHCAEDITSGLIQPASAYEVVTGRLNWEDPSGGQVLHVQAVIVNPGYTLTTFGTDAALLILSSPTTAPPLTLAGSEDASLIDPGTVASIAGWGLTSGSATTPPTSLQWGTTTVQNATYCTTAETTDDALFDPAVDVCALDTPGDTITACHGDSGGPLVVDDSAGTPIEVGITSRGDANCDPSYPTIFTSAASISSWAADWIAQYPPPPAALVAAAAPPTSPAPADPPSRPRAGAYSGRTSQRAGHVSLSVASNGASIARVELVFALRCSHGGPRGTYSQLVPGSTPLRQGTNSSGTEIWSFARSFNGQHGWHFTLSGTLGANGQASGMLAVRTHARGCGTGRIAWTG
jgi:secreted trypsin-like serine protease